jgi:hypothetical protein
VKRGTPPLRAEVAAAKQAVQRSAPKRSLTAEQLGREKDEAEAAVLRQPCSPALLLPSVAQCRAVVLKPLASPAPVPAPEVPTSTPILTSLPPMPTSADDHATFLSKLKARTAALPPITPTKGWLDRVLMPPPPPRSPACAIVTPPSPPQTTTVHAKTAPTATVAAYAVSPPAAEPDPQALHLDWVQQVKDVVGEDLVGDLLDDLDHSSPPEVCNLVDDVISLVECGVVYVGRWEAGLGHYIGWGTPACLSYQVTYL